MTPETIIIISSSSENNPDLKNLGELSSFLFLLGACICLAALVKTGPGGEVLEKTLFGTAFGCFILHVLPQVILDLRYSQRPVAHSRYGTRSRWINLLQSALFAVGAFFQGASYWVWVSQDDDPDDYTNLNIIGAYLWLASGVLTALFQCFCCARTENAWNSAWNSVLHRVGNCIYITATVIFVLGAYVWKDQPNDFLGDVLLQFCFLLLIIVGILYVAGDCTRELPRAEAPTSEPSITDTESLPETVTLEKDAVSTSLSLI
jgi:hypothetical protein